MAWVTLLVVALSGLLVVAADPIRLILIVTLAFVAAIAAAGILANVPIFAVIRRDVRRWRRARRTRRWRSTIDAEPGDNAPNIVLTVGPPGEWTVRRYRTLPEEGGPLASAERVICTVRRSQHEWQANGRKQWNGLAAAAKFPQDFSPAPEASDLAPGRYEVRWDSDSFPVVRTAFTLDAPGKIRSRLRKRASMRIARVRDHYFPR